jgi:hypothetical protein
MISGLFVALGVTALAASAAPAPAPTPAAPVASPAPKLSKWQREQLEKFKNSAPADEYFGKMKMSYLGMNNTFRDAAISSGDHTIDPGIINKVTFAEDALEAWAKKYPRDPQLARTYFLATKVERKIWTKEAQGRAWVNLNRLVQQFPSTYFGKLLAKDLAIGYTQHYYAPPVPCATPAPVLTPGDDVVAAGIGGGFATPVPAPTDPPTPGPTPSPMETTLSKGLRVQVIAQACVPPATPAPSPSPSPSPSPAPIPAPAVSGTPTGEPAAASTPATVPSPAVTSSP